MDKGSVFDYTDFKDYLLTRFSTSGTSRGMRINFARLIHASPSYVTKVLSGKIKLSLEHVPVINHLLQHTEQESKFFMLLVLHSQAGSRDLEVHFKRELDMILEEKRATAEWIPDKHELPGQIQAKYYSHWYYMVIHMMTSVPAYQSKTAIAQRLKLSMTTVTNALDYLMQIGVVEKKGERYGNTKRRVHIQKNSDWIPHIHMNTRQLALQKLPEATPEDLHYSLVLSLSHKDREVIRKKISQMLQELEPMMTNNKNEDVCVLTIDFFRA